MSEFRLSPEAEAELDGIWIHMARDSGSVDLATRVVEGINERFWLLARYPYMGRRAWRSGSGCAQLRRWRLRHPSPYRGGRCGVDSARRTSGRRIILTVDLGSLNLEAE